MNEVSPDKLIFTETDTETVDISNPDDGIHEINYSGTSINHKETGTKLLFAHYENDIYIYRTLSLDYSREYIDGYSANDSTINHYELRVKSGETVETLLSFDSSNDEVVSLDPNYDYINPGNYNNNASSYAVNTYYYDYLRFSAYDGKIIVCCFDLNDSDITTAQDLRARPKTLLFDSLQEYVIHNYRVDYNANYSRIYPITVTSIDKAEA